MNAAELTAHELTAHAERLNIPLRTLSDVRVALTDAQAQGADKSMARLMLRFGRLTEEARAFVADWK